MPSSMSSGVSSDSAITVIVPTGVDGSSVERAGFKRSDGPSVTVGLTSNPV